MKIYREVLTNETIRSIRIETQQSLGKSEWRVSTLSWNPDLRRGIQSSSMAKYLSEGLSGEVEDQIKHLLPPYDRLLQQIYLWAPGSGISLHADVDKKFGLTIYLNEQWDIDFGGLFVWEDGDSNELKVKKPEFNSMILSDCKEPHLVTPVAIACPVLRHTLQIWGC